MKCSCPKCKTDISEDLAEIPDDGVLLRCAACNTNFNLKKESFARRALRRGEDITCAECSSQLGPAIYCQSCHALYPDYYITETTSAAKKQLGKVLTKFKSINRLGKARTVSHQQSKYMPAATAKKKTKGIKLLNNPAQLALTLGILLVILGGFGFYYYQQKIENEYMGNYVKALFVIKTSEDYNIKLCEKIAVDWRTRQSATAPAPIAAERTFLSRGLKDSETTLNKARKAPKKYTASAEALVHLHEIYKKHQTLTASPTGSLESFAAASKTLENDFRKSAIALKSVLPEKLSAKLDAAKTKFKELQNF